jgi:glycosyltransferase involved in cell wall biosynthesis
VVIATSTPLTVGIPGMLVSRFRRIPLVFEVRDLWPEAPIQMGIIRNKAAWKVLRALERAIYRSSSRIIALSPGMRDGVVAAGTPPENVTVIPNCSDLDLFEPGAPDTSLVEKFALQDRFVAVYAGAMGEANAVDIVLDAATALQSKSEAPITFLMVGAGKKAEELQKRARDLGLRNMVFVGSVSRREVPAFLRLGSVCLVLFKNVPVLGTNSPNKMFDAFASGRPVIVNNDGWTRELVRQHGVGLTAEPGSAESLVDQLLRLAGNRRETLEMGHRARRLAEEAFDRRRLAVQFESVLRQTVEGNQGETGRAQGEQAMDHEHISQAAAAMAEAPNGVEDAPQPPLDHVHAME